MPILFITRLLEQIDCCRGHNFRANSLRITRVLLMCSIVSSCWALVLFVLVVLSNLRQYIFNSRYSGVLLFNWLKKLVNTICKLFLHFLLNHWRYLSQHSLGFHMLLELVVLCIFFQTLDYVEEIELLPFESVQLNQLLNCHDKYFLRSWHYQIFRWQFVEYDWTLIQKSLSLLCIASSQA